MHERASERAPCEKAREAATSCDVEAVPEVDARRERAAVLRRKRCDMMLYLAASLLCWWLTRQECRSDSSSLPTAVGTTRVRCPVNKSRPEDWL